MNYLIYLAIALSTYIFYKVHQSFKPPKEIEHVPAVSFFSLILSFLSGQLFDLRYEKLYKPALSKFGYARLWMRGYWEIIISDPKQAREILGNSEVFLKKPKGDDVFSKRMLIIKFFGMDNIASNDGDDWRRHSRIANPAFKKAWNNDIFGNCTTELIEKLIETNQEPIVVHSMFQKLTLDVLGHGLFSYNFEAVKKGESSHFLKVYNEIMSAIFNPIYFTFPILEEWIPSRKYYHQRNDEFREFLMNIIKDRKNELNQGINKGDLLSLMIRASMEETEESARLTDEEVLDDLATFFLAGHDTTANTLTSTFYFLAKHQVIFVLFPQLTIIQDIQEKARREVLEEVGDTGSIVLPTSEQSKSMTYINCIIKESMRCIPTSAQLRRYCNADITLSDGLVIPEKCFAVIETWALHHDPNVFPDPEKFNPDRFLEVHGEQDQAWMPFGDGSRMWINFSLTEQRVTIAMLLQKFKIILGPNSSQREKPIIKAAGLLYPSDMDVCFIPRF